MARKIIQPDLAGRMSHEQLSAWEERLSGVRSVTKWLTIPGCMLAAVMVVTHISSVMNGWGEAWRWMLLCSLGLAAALAQSAIRLKWRRWSWLGFAAALVVHGYSMYRCYLAFADDYGVMEIIPELEMLLLAALLVLHGLWSLLASAAAKEKG